MMKIIWLAFLFSVLVAQNKEMSALEIIGEIDKNMNAKTRVLTSKMTVSYTHLRAHETKANLVCRLLLEKKNLSV